MKKYEGKDLRLRSENVSKMEWCILGFFFVAFFAIFLYSDICHTTSRGIMFWNCLFEGRLNEFYASAYPGVPGSYLPDGTYSGAYDILLYIFFAIWDFPLWCFEKLTGLSFLSVYGGKLYAKGIILAFLCLSAWILRKIAVHITDSEELSNWAVFLFFASSLTVSAVIVQGGYDIISVFFTLLGIYWYLQGKDWRFVWAFAVAVTCKMFALFIFVPLLLLRHKSILKILGKGLVSISLIVIPKILAVIGNTIIKLLEKKNLIDAAEVIIVRETDILLASNDANSAIASNSVIAHSNIINDNMFAHNAGAISFSEIPLFFFITFLLWWICWKKKEATQYEIIYYCLLSMSIFVLFVDMNPYWIILLVPYIILILITNIDKFRDNVILEMIFSMGFVVFQAYKRYWCYSFELFTKMFDINPEPIKDYRICGIVKIMNTFHEISGISTENICSLFICCFALGLILFLYDNRPGQQMKHEVNFRTIRLCSWGRMIPALVVVFLPFTEVVIYWIKTVVLF